MLRTAQRPVARRLTSGVAGARPLFSGAALAVVVLALGLAATGAVASSGVLSDPGALVRWGRPATRLAQDLAAMVTVGLLVLRALALPTDLRPHPDRLGDLERRAMRCAAVGAVVWAAAGVAWYVLACADIVGRPLTDPLVWRTLPVLAQELSVASAQVQAVVLVLVAAAGALAARGPRLAGAATLAALMALILPTQVAHAAREADHGAATVAMAMHVGGAAAWAGGLVGLVVLRRHLGPALARTAREFSTTAGICFALVALSGVVNVVVRIEDEQQASGTYLLLVAAKVAALAVLGVAGWRHRTSALGQLDAGTGSPSAFWRLVGVEVLVIAVAFGLAVAMNELPASA